MVSGRMQCIGSVQHLKGRFGGGYQVEVRTSTAKKGVFSSLLFSGVLMEFLLLTRMLQMNVLLFVNKFCLAR